jgi:hypothetical protein
MVTAAAAWVTWAAWADTKIVTAVCDRRGNHERGWKKFQPRFLLGCEFNKIDVDFNFIKLYKTKEQFNFIE